jgi:hypothetical protein
MTMRGCCCCLWIYRCLGVWAVISHPPLIEKSGRENWIVIFLLVDEEGKTLVREHALMLVQRWVDEESGQVGCRED